MPQKRDDKTRHKRMAHDSPQLGGVVKNRLPFLPGGLVGSFNSVAVRIRHRKFNAYGSLSPTIFPVQSLCKRLMKYEGGKKVTPLWLRVFMGGGSRLLSGGLHSQVRNHKRACDSFLYIRGKLTLDFRLTSLYIVIKVFSPLIRGPGS
ncbi:hypothetical protein EVAR_63866_1 [Eumeta japonica]|uniref:Uncharacterized protein n=1 Tax=Eumeta variegata TaxID=151549 RepID=A0A4C2A2R4_EUMVA|nr:hypothetical protein EVAR_63866_1 [Eumeta japonica]